MLSSPIAIASAVKVNQVMAELLQQKWQIGKLQQLFTVQGINSSFS